MNEQYAYGLWSLVIINSLIFIIFAFSFTKPRTSCDWRSFSAFSAFIVAVFVEMYGFPLAIYLISGWLVRRYPGLDPLSHNAGHLWNTLIGWKIDAHFDPLIFYPRPQDLCESKIHPTDADIYKMIASGGPSMGHPSGMISFGGSLDKETIKELVAHIRSFCKK